MADSINGGNKKEMSMELRLLLAFLLMGAIMFSTQYFFKPATPPPLKKTAPAAQVAQPAPENATTPESTPAQAPAAAEPAEAATASAPTSPATPKQALPPYIIDTGVFRVVFSNQGANVRSWQLKKYKGNDDKPLELMNPAAAIEDPYPFSLYIPDQQPLARKVNWAYYQPAGDPVGLGLTYEFSDGHTTARKTFRFRKNSYLVEVSTELAIDGKPVPHMIAWRGGFGDLTVANPAGNEKTLFYDLTANKLVEQTARSAKNGPIANGSCASGFPAELLSR